MNLSDIVHRTPRPAPWAEGDNIPWNEPGFSQRMLAEHLSQDHDAASRRSEIIDEQVSWIHTHLLAERPSRVLDLACGPGLYANRLTRFGHSVTGVDYSPASIRYARQQAEEAGLSITYIESDLRNLEYGGLYDFAMLIYGEFNVFRPADAALILEKIYRALKPGGLLLLEPQDLAYLQNTRSEAAWRAYPQGLFSDRPHLYLYENFWDSPSLTLTTRYWVVDAASAEVTRYAQTAQGYTDAALEALLESQGFSGVKTYPALAPKEGQARQAVYGVTAVRK